MGRRGRERQLEDEYWRLIPVAAEIVQGLDSRTPQSGRPRAFS
jgi:hypothetical protein